jgi:hypothetical protein
MTKCGLREALRISSLLCPFSECVSITVHGYSFDPESLGCFVKSSGSTLARRESLGHATIGRIYEEFTYLQAQERRNQPCPRVLGIDEHTLHRGQRFVTTFCNLKTGKSLMWLKERVRAI